MVWQPDEELVISTTGDIILDINSDLMKFHSETQTSLERIPVDPTWEHPPTASLAALRTQVRNCWLYQ